MTRHVLVVDADVGDRDFLAETLDLAGFTVTSAASGVAGLVVARSQDIDLVVLDLTMPRLDGLQTLRRLRSDARTSHLPVLLTTAPGHHRDAVEGLDAGADDTLAKPIAPEVLVAHVRAALRRADLQRSLNPLTGLPGNERILTELSARLQLEEPVALLYVDLDQFKPFNDHYGFLRGDEALQALAGLLREVARDIGDEETFLGHVGGDDFVIVLSPDLAEPLAKTLCARFDALAPSLYDPDDRRAGGIEVADRRGVPQRFGLLSVSVGVAATVSGEVVHHGELVAIATEMKRYAKSHGKPGSTYAVDRRHVGDPVDLEVDLP